MVRLTRKNIKVFAGNATNNGVFGSLQAGNPVTTTNVEQIQSLPAWSVGWNSATMTSEKLPPLEEFQGIQYVTTYQQAYLMQEGMPEWASTVTYYKGSLAKKVTSNGFRIYCSLTNDNTNNLLSDTSNWKKVMDSSDLYAYDSAVVHLNGTETITGTKTFTSNVKVSKSIPFVDLYNTNITKGTTPSSSQIGRNAMCDKDGKFIAMTQYQYLTDGRIEAILRAYNPKSETSYAQIGVAYKTDGTVFTAAPRPTDTTTTSGTQIATTGWVNSVGNNVVHLTGNETIAGNKTLSGSATFQTEITQSSTLPVVYLKNTRMTKGTAPSEELIVFVRFRDSADKDMGALRYGYGTNKESKVSLRANKANASGDTAVAELMLTYPASGNPYATCPTPTENNTSSVQIDTVGARNTQINAILSALYPVGSIYIGTQSSCPLATLISGSTWTKVSSDKVLQTSSSSHSANSTIAAGLPNITGDLFSLSDYVKSGSTNKAFSKTSTSRTRGIGSGDNTEDWYQYKFSASGSSSIYGASTTVQPPAYVVNVWRRTA